jgi:hypothetical protein
VASTIRGSTPALLRMPRYTSIMERNTCFFMELIVELIAEENVSTL